MPEIYLNIALLVSTKTILHWVLELFLKIPSKQVVEVAFVACRKYGIPYLHLTP